MSLWRRPQKIFKQGNSDEIGTGQRAAFLCIVSLAVKEMMKEVVSIRISPFGDQPKTTLFKVDSTCFFKGTLSQKKCGSFWIFDLWSKESLSDYCIFRRGKGAQI